MDIHQIVINQRKYFKSGATLNIDERLNNLKKLEALIKEYLPKFNEAFKKDYNKCPFDVLSTEIYLVLEDIKYMIKHLKKLSKPKRVKTSLINFPSKGYLINEPYGVVLVMAPWNYPFQLALEPLVGALASGNTVVVKPGSYCKNVSETINELLSHFDERLIKVVLGGREQNQQLLEERFDYIFFTGGVTVGKLVLEKANRYLTPVTLELGGKSPCIVDEDADLEIAARRIVWGKYLNAGQTCVAPDFIYVHQKIHDQFIHYVKEYIKQFYYDQNHQITANFPYLINEKHLNKVMSLVDEEKIIIGQKSDNRLVEPIVLDHVTWDDKIMSEEIFGPVMPILEFTNLNEVINLLKDKEKPLAFYYFSKNKKKAKEVMKSVSYGGGCINDTIMHLTNENLPFGGVGLSGYGAYHGKKSYETFSHQKSVLMKGKTELNVKYPPYRDTSYNMLKWLSKIKN